MSDQPNFECSAEAYAKLKDTVLAKAPHMPETDYKIVLFGVLQAGKSSFINTMHSAMEGKYKQIEHSAPGERSVTQKFSASKLELRGADLWLCDTKGYELASDGDRCDGPTIEEVERILDGELDHDYLFGDMTDFTKQRSNSEDGGIGQNSNFVEDVLVYEPKTKRETNLVGIVWDAAAKYDPRLIAVLQRVLEEATKRRIMCCVLLTKVDKCSEGVQRDLGTVVSDEKVLELRERVRDLLGIEISNIFPMQNYSGQRESTAINCFALHTLTRLLELADLTMQRCNRDDALRLLREPWRKDVLKDRASAAETLQSLVADVMKTSAIEAINVAVIGLSGSGKSRVINALLSALHGKQRTDAPTGQATKKLTCYNTPFKLHLYDCQGLTTDDQETAVQQLQALVEGHIPEGTDLATYTKNIPTTLPGRVKRWFTPIPKLSQRMHAVILVIDGNSFPALTKDSDERSLLKAAFHRVTELRVPCVVAVSYLDKVCQRVQKSPSHMFSSAGIRKCVMKIRDSDLAVEFCDILPVLTWHDPLLEEEGGEETRHALLLHALLHVCDKVKDYSAEKPRPRRVTITSVLQTFVVAVLVMIAAVVLHVILARKL